MIREYQARFKMKNAPDHQNWSSWSAIDDELIKDIRSFDKDHHFKYEFRTVYIHDGILEDEDIVPWECPEDTTGFRNNLARALYILHAGDFLWAPKWEELPLDERKFWVNRTPNV